MELAQQFFAGLDGQASITFFAFLVGAFLIGLLPVGISYGYRLRNAERKLQKFKAGYQQAAQERSMLAGQVQREEDKSLDFSTRLRQATSERARAEAALARKHQQLEEAKAETVTTQLSVRDREDYVAGLRNRIATLQGQVQDLKSSSRPQAPQMAFDLNAVASLKASRAQVKSLETRVTQLTEDNERMRRQLAV